MAFARPLTVLGLESSCDDTAAAVIRAGRGPMGREILSNVVASQDTLHVAFGGVVPEIAARAHAERLDAVTERALSEAGVGLSDLDAVAVTAGPGLLGGVVAGVCFAKGLSAGAGLPLVGVNHLAGHALTPRLTDGLPYPYVTLLVSGGHCQLLLVRGWSRYERLGGTIDDAPGEAFDKVARALGLPQPGGPAVEREAASGDAGRFALPRPLLGRLGCDMSFSGLKTAVLRARDGALVDGALPERARADLCAGFQAAVRDVLAHRAGRALDRHPGLALAVTGGVAANGAVRGALSSVCAERGVPFVAPPLGLCTDNGAIIAWAGMEAFAAGHRDGLDLAARPALAPRRPRRADAGLRPQGRQGMRRGHARRGRAPRPGSAPAAPTEGCRSQTPPARAASPRAAALGRAGARSLRRGGLGRVVVALPALPAERIDAELTHDMRGNRPLPSCPRSDRPRRARSPCSGSPCACRWARSP